MVKETVKGIGIKDLKIVLERIPETMINSNDADQPRRSERIRNMQFKQSNVMPAKRTQRIQSIASSNPASAFTSILVNPGRRCIRSKSVAFDTPSRFEKPNVENHSNNLQNKHSSNVSVNKPKNENRSNTASKAEGSHSSNVPVPSNKANNGNRSGELNKSQNRHLSKNSRLMKKPSIESRSRKVIKFKNIRSFKNSQALGNSNKQSIKSRSGKWVISKRQLKNREKKANNDINAGYEEQFDSNHKKALIDSIKMQDAQIEIILNDRDLLQHQLNESHRINSILVQEIDAMNIEKGSTSNELRQVKSQNEELEMANTDLQAKLHKMSRTLSTNDAELVNWVLAQESVPDAEKENVPPLVLRELCDSNLRNEKLVSEKGVLQTRLDNLNRNLFDVRKKNDELQSIVNTYSSQVAEEHNYQMTRLL